MTDRSRSRSRTLGVIRETDIEARHYWSSMPAIAYTLPTESGLARMKKCGGRAVLSISMSLFLSHEVNARRGFTAGMLSLATGGYKDHPPIYHP